MKIKDVSLKDLIPYENNPRFNDDAVDGVAESIKDFGFKVPMVIDKNNVIVCGHTRYKAAEKLGLKSVPCVVADDLSEEEIKKFRIIDNKAGEVAEWDFDKLSIEIADMDLDLSDFGFDEVGGVQIEEKEEPPEVEFTEVLLEEHNYIVLYFDNSVDWLQAESIFDIGTKKCLSTRQDGNLAKNMERKRIGRVLDGKKALEMLREYYENFS